ncbi:major facilitator superfamily MFS_1 [Acidimicrobium ferrooxidans DSM 10331]|uniref:Major facilitator superfamily MFS_1 n=1 Tax=Acidimicrobium ferrooxidans (strain DSM 10331 / JCM 15462 / NBRC 103882 / ICP) TaxID=525909 RepID=C7LZV7_ACIFD|nr:MFS transporter [Acidimicrobium ferrooxidans]ACU54265.1 major facilitator superfamily MFS_1 [Acidimicrobium ferrooxidans DSM 10331]
MRPAVPPALREPGFRLLVAGQLASTLGDLAYAVALPWYVLAQHDGPILLAAVLAAYGVPRTAFVAVGGFIADRVRPWTAMLIADGTRTAAAGLLAAVALHGPAQPAVLIPIALVLGACEGIFLPASFSIIPALIAADQLQGANATSTAATQLATLLGPAFGGLIVGIAGPGTGFGIDAATFAVSAGSLALIAHHRTDDAVHSHGPASTSTRQAGPAPSPPLTLRRLLVHEPVLLLMIATTVAANLGLGGLSEVALPVFARTTLHADATGYGVILASFGAGGLVGALAAARLPRLHRPLVVGGTLLTSATVLLLLMPATASLPIAAIDLAGFSALLAVANIVMVTAVQLWADPRLLGRIMSMMVLASVGLFPVSVAIAGFAVRAIGASRFVDVAGLALLLAALAVLATPASRRFASPPAAPAPELAEPAD